MSTHERLLTYWLSLTRELGELSPSMRQSLKPGIVASELLRLEEESGVALPRGLAELAESRPALTGEDLVVAVSERLPLQPRWLRWRYGKSLLRKWKRQLDALAGGLIAAFMVSFLLGGAPLAADRNESCYRIDEAGVTYYREQFDPQFKRKHVTKRPMPEADPGSFVDLEGFDCLCCAKDRDHVFWQERLVPGADPETFRYLGGGYADDGGQIFFRGRAVREADHASFEVYSFEDDRQRFVDAHDRRRLYLRGLWLRDLSAKPNAASLVALDRFFFQDDRAVYRVHKARQSRDNDLLPLPEADPETFRLVGREHGSFARDARRVFLYSKGGRRFRILEPDDIESFEILNLHYAKDSEQAYFQGDPLPEADVETLEADGHGRAKDRFRTYDVRGKTSLRRGD